MKTNLGWSSSCDAVVLLTEEKLLKALQMGQARVDVRCFFITLKFEVHRYEVDTPNHH